jgi:ATP-dependent helicase/nuclease subunit B
VSEKSLILGRAGSGKTRLLLETFCQGIKAKPLDHALFLLPTHSQVEHIKDVIIRKGFAPGLVEEGICTFSQLAREALGYYGLRGPITELEKGFMLREVLKGSPLKYFEGKEGLQGLHTALLRFFKELKEDDQYPSQFRTAVDKFLERQGTTSPEKYIALAEVYYLYQKALEKRGLLDEDDLLNQFLHALETDKTLLSQKELLLVDGFHDFTPVEFRILKLLIHRIPRVLASLVLDTDTVNPRQAPLRGRSASDGMPPFEHCHAESLPFLGWAESPPFLGRAESPPFLGRAESPPFLGRAVYKDLKALGLRPRALQGFHRSTSPTLRQIERGLFNPASEPIEADNVLEVIEAADLRDEVEQIARHIYQMVSSGEAEYHEIVIIFREITLYRDIIEAVFQEYDLPVRIHARKPLAENPIVKCLCTLLRVFANSWRDEEVLHTLKSPYVALPPPEVDALEVEVLRNGRLDSKTAWLKFLEKLALTCLPHTKKFIQTLAEMEEELAGLHPPSFFRSWLLKFIERFISLPEVLNPTHSCLLKEESQGIKALLELLDRQCQLVPSSLTAKEFFESVLGSSGSLSSTSYLPRDKRHEVVNVIDALEARQWEKPVVFVGGLLEKQFPRQGREDIFLKDKERRAFKRLTGINLQEVLTRTHEEERFLFYIALTRAGQRLILSYPATDDQGRPTLPSFFLEEAKRLFTDESYKKVLKKRGPADFLPKPQEILTQRDLRNFLFHNLTSRYTPEAYHDLARGVYNRELGKKTSWLEGLRAAMERPESGSTAGEEGELGTDSPLKELISSFSATQLSDYAQCPFLHFCRWVLRLRPLPNRAEEGLSPTLQGEIVHETLKRYYQKLASEATANLEDLFLESFTKKTRGIPHGFKEEKLKKEMLHALKVFAEQDKEYITRFPFRPKYLEVGFGKETDNKRFIAQEGTTTSRPLSPLRLKYKNGTTVTLTGRIDRIDVAEIEGETLGLVIDYKYSREVPKEKRLDEDLREGTDLQLPIYVMVARDLLGLKPVGAQFYSLRPPGRSGIITLPLPNKGEHLSPEEMESLLEDCKRLILKQIEGILSGDKEVNPRDLRKCQEWCDYREVCRFERARHKKYGE